jgi:hypothetical protein
MAGCAGNWLPIVDADIIAWIEGHKPAIRETNVQGWCILRLAVRSRRGMPAKFMAYLITGAKRASVPNSGKEYRKLNHIPTVREIGRPEEIV